MKKNIAIFGAGKAGQRASKKLSKRYHISYFVDNAATEPVLSKYPCFKPERLITHPVDFIFICSMYFEQIHQQLVGLGIKNVQVYKATDWLSDVNAPYRKIQKIKTEQSPLYLIYQVGKVGSNTIHNGLSKAGLKSMSFHTFRSSDIYAQWGITPKGLTSISHNISMFNPWLARRALQHRQRHGKNTTVITGVRDPVSRAISILMQSLHILLPEHLNRAHTVEGNFLTLFEEMFYRWIDFDYFFNWFNDEFSYVTGVNDLQSGAFDSSKSMRLIKADTCDVLIYRQDKLTDLIQSDFLGCLPGISQYTESGNRSEHKWYSSLSKEIKTKFVVDKKLAKKIYASDYCKTFFSSAEREALFKKWTTGER